MSKRAKLIRVVTTAQSFGLLKGQLRYLQDNGLDVVALGAGEEQMARVAVSEGVRTIGVDMHREIAIKEDIRSLMRLIRVFRKEKPDIVHAHTPKGSLLSMVAAWLTRVPVRIYTVTGLRFETATGNFRRLLKMMERISCFCANKVIPEGDGVRKTLLRNKITGKELVVVNNGNINGVDGEEFMPGIHNQDAVDELCRPDCFTFIFVGRLVKDKGIKELVKAFSHVKERHPETRLFLLGREEPELDPLDDETKETIAKTPSINAVGFKADVRPYLEASDVLVHPSYREGFPNVILQAGAMGLPCIVTDINGSNEAISEGKNGLIVPKYDVMALAKAMCRVIEDKTLYDDMAKTARPMTMSRFDRSDVQRATLEMYKGELLKHKKTKRL